MARYNAYDDDITDIDIEPKGPGRFIPWLLGFALLGGAAYQGSQLYQVAYGGVPGDFIGQDVNQILPEEAVVNEASARVFAAADATSPVLFNAKAGTRIKVLGRDGAFVKIPLPKGQVGFIDAFAITPGFLFLENPIERERYERRFFPKRFTWVTKSLWESKGRGRSILAVEVGNYSAVPIDAVSLRIFFQDEKGLVMETLDVVLEGRIEAGEKRDWEDVVIQLPSGERYEKSEMEVIGVRPSTV